MVGPDNRDPQNLGERLLIARKSWPTASLSDVYDRVLMQPLAFLPAPKLIVNSNNGTGLDKHGNAE